MPDPLCAEKPVLRILDQSAERRLIVQNVLYAIQNGAPIAQARRNSSTGRYIASGSKSECGPTSMIAARKPAIRPAASETANTIGVGTQFFIPAESGRTAGTAGSAIDSN